MHHILNTYLTTAVAATTRTNGLLSNLLTRHRNSVAPSLLLQLTSIRTIKEPVYPPLNETEIRELFTKGSGPGGQKVNKATNRCELKHLPTGIIVASHDTRSLEENRRIARKLLQQRLDFYYNKENSYLARALKEKQDEKREKNRRAVKNLEKKRLLKQESESLHSTE